MYKGDEDITFLKGGNNGIELLQEKLQDPAATPQDLYRIKVSSLRETYRYISWNFTTITGQESMTTIPWLAIHILHFRVHGNVIFGWEKIYLMNSLHN
jgi:hypothetical protein